MFVTDTTFAGSPAAASHSAPATTLPQPCLRQAVLTLPAQEAHVRTVRHFAAELLQAWGVHEDERDSAILIVDELTANAARYGHQTMTLLLALVPHSLHIVVTDAGTSVERAPLDIADDEHGRGAGIVEFLAEWTEVHQTPDGREVHSCLACAA
jgi:anti-sigma regulatory factor (Ser/Thr protein kinase)